VLHLHFLFAEFVENPLGILSDSRHTMPFIHCGLQRAPPLLFPSSEDLLLQKFTGAAIVMLVHASSLQPSK
jgi:hypothetical protein